MAGHRPRWKRCIWRSRRRWRPATPSTNPGPWLSNARPGSAKPQRVLGSAEAVASMVQTALSPHAETATIADSHWVAQTADHILTVMEASRSTWQMWHVRAEAQRQVRTTDVAAEQAAALVDLLVDDVLNRRSVPLAAPADNIEEPEPLRRVDGSSVYTVAGAIPTPRSGSSTPRPVSSPRPDSAAVRPSSRRRSTWPCSKWRRTGPPSMLDRPL
jgi:hypothetical protein